MNTVNFNNTGLVDKYTVVARYMDGVKVVGYHLIDSQGKEHAVTKETVEALALNKSLLNVSGQRYKNDIVIKGVNCKLSELPVIDAHSGKLKGEENNKKKSSPGKFTLTARITKGKSTVGYVLKDAAGVERRIKREDVLLLARDGRLANARAQSYEGNLLLRGVGFELAQLPTIKM